MKAELERGPQPDDFSCLVDMLRRLDAPSGGERLAAFEACTRALTALGLRWRDIADALPVTGQASARYIARAAQAMCDGQGVLSPFEVQFLLGIEGVHALSGGQHAELDRIARKVETARAAGGPAGRSDRRARFDL